MKSFGRVRVFFLETAADGGNPAGRIDGRTVGATHLLKKNGFGTAFGGFKGRAHTGKTGADYDDVPVFRAGFLVGRLGLSGRTDEARAKKISA